MKNPITRMLIRKEIEKAKLKRKNSRLRRKLLPRYPVGIEVGYGRQLKGLVDALEEKIKARLFPYLPQILLSGSVGDVAADDAADAIGALLRAATMDFTIDIPPSQVESIVRKRASEINNFNARDLNRLFAMAISVEPFGGEEWIEKRIGLFVKENVSRIKGITDDGVRRIGDDVLAAARAGRRVDEVQSMVIRDLGVSKSRAELIARDQIGSLNGELTKARQTEAGISEYTWETSRDERVREAHKRLQGKTFPWAQPPVMNKKGDRGNPGEDIQCRCVAIPVIK